MHTGKIDATALFPGGKCAPTPVRAEAPPEDWDDQLNDTPQDDVPAVDRMIRRDTDAGSVSGDQPDVDMSGQQGGSGSAPRMIRYCKNAKLYQVMQHRCYPPW